MKKNIENCKSLRTVTHAGSGNMREIVTLEDLIGLVCNGIDQTKARLLSIFRRIHRCSFFPPFWAPFCYIIHIFNLKACEAKPTGNEWAYISLWSDILWTLRVLVRMHAYFITMKTSSGNQCIKFSLVYSFYCHYHDSEKAKWHLILFLFLFIIFDPHHWHLTFELNEDVYERYENKWIL